MTAALPDGVRLVPGRKLRILDFDTECRPMHYSDWRPESQMTAVAWSWVGSDQVECEVLEQDLSNERSMLAKFLLAFDAADIVTGHYILKHDLPLIVDHCIRLGLELPKGVQVSDTKIALPKVKGLGMSQENLSLTLGVSAEKHHMAGSDWRIANTLDPAGRAAARKRVIDDVKQNKELRRLLVERRLLKPPTYWRP